MEDSGVVDTTWKGGRKVQGGGVLATAQLVTGGAVVEHDILATASLVMTAASWCPGTWCPREGRVGSVWDVRRRRPRSGRTVVLRIGRGKLMAFD
jgi:hypothetical protein